MEKFIRIWCEHWYLLFNKIIQKYNSNIKTNYWCIDRIINYKIKNNKDIIYKEDIPKILGFTQEEFMEYVMEEVKHRNLDINNLKLGNYKWYPWFYYMSTFLDNEPVDIKIALKD